MRENNFHYHTMAEVEKRGWSKVMEDIIKEANDGPEYLFISFDIDVLDPAFVPGTGTPEPGGLTPREAFPLVRRLCAESNVVGFELVELNPVPTNNLIRCQFWEVDLDNAEIGKIEKSASRV